MSPDHYVLRPVPVEQRERWDQFVVQHPAGHLLQSWGWGELKVNTGWDPLRFALWDTEQERMVATVSALRYSAPREPLRAGHFAYIPKGPVLDWLQPMQCNALFSQMNTLLRAQDVLAWYQLLQTTSKREQFGIHTLDYYLQAWRIFVPRNQARLLLAEYSGQLLAGIFVGLLGKQAIYLYGAS